MNQLAPVLTIAPPDTAAAIIAVAEALQPDLAQGFTAALNIAGGKDAQGRDHPQDR